MKTLEAVLVVRGGPQPYEDTMLVFPLFWHIPVCLQLLSGASVHCPALSSMVCHPLINPLVCNKYLVTELRSDVKSLDIAQLRNIMRHMMKLTD
jgi:hypothetical protein